MHNLFVGKLAEKIYKNVLKIKRHERRFTPGQYLCLAVLYCHQVFLALNLRVCGLMDCRIV